MSQDFLYDRVGVDTGRAVAGLGVLARSVNETLRFRDASGFGRPAMGLGYYANVLELPGGQGLAISTDGVGTKIIVAELARRFDTIPIDMIAMNVNDLLCVGAEPFALVDYIACGEVDDELFEQLGRGLLEGARQARVTIPGGEIAQVKELLRGHGGGGGLDLVGTAVGLVPWDRINVGQDIAPGDAVLGIPSSGLHSNGYTLARHVLLERGRLGLNDRVEELGRTLAEELLEPTRIYVEPVLALRDAGISCRALLHVTGDGYANLNRVAAEVGFVIDALPEPSAIFRMIQDIGGLDDAEMFTVFNMGIGFCCVVPDAEADRALSVLAGVGAAASRIGHATADHPDIVRLTQYGLAGGRERLRPESP